MDIKKIIVVGAGPAGMMAAIRAGQLKQDVLLIEKNTLLGKKLLLSGKGRCNLTNASDLHSFIKKFSHDAEFLRDAFKKLFNFELMDFFEKRGLKLKTERQLRVFPVSNKSSSIVDLLEKELQKNKVNILYKATLKDIFIQDNKVKGVLLGDGRAISADKLILATGGVSFNFTGSTGEGMDLARKLGHRIAPLRPGLVPLEVRQPYPGLLEGLTLKNIRIRFTPAPIGANQIHNQLVRGYSKKPITSDVGELLFTRSGISGPLVLSLSGQIADWLREGSAVYADIDLKPALSKEQVNGRLLRELKLNSKKSLKNILKEVLPLRFIAVFLDILKISADKKASYITQDERKRITGLLKAFRLDIVRTRPIGEAMVTRGGVSLKDINPRTMESRLIKGLYFCGEMIDIDADTGGFNLQAAFSTGYLAGESAALAA